jgi:two-component system response regulator HydG
MADLLPHGLFTTDPAGRITFWNRGAERITGWSRDEALGRSCSLLAGDAVNGCACGAGPVRCGLVQRTRSAKTCTLRARDGRLVLIVKSAVALLASDGTPVGALESFSEIGPAAPARRVAPRGAPPSCPTVERLFGEHPAMKELRRTIALVAASGATVLISGESGAGKNLVAEVIHAESGRAAAPLVCVRCAGFDERLVEAADGGTLLLDEIADLSTAAQAALLRLLEQHTIAHQDDPTPVPVDLRLLCTTHRDPRALVAAGRLRADLYFRLAAFPVLVPPLREHLGDVPVIARAYLARWAPTTTGRARAIAPAALARLIATPWPGNVRELENVLAVAALRAGEGDVELKHLPAQAATAAARRRGPPTADELREALERSGWNRTAAARELGMSRVTLWKVMKRVGLGTPVR